MKLSLHVASLVLAFIYAPSVSSGQDQQIVELRSGIRLGPGTIEQTDSITTNAFQQGSSGEVQSKPIGVLNDGLRRTYFNNSMKNVINRQASTALRPVEIEFPSAAEVASGGNPPAFSAILEISAFNKYARRNYVFQTARGPVSVLQGITLLTPKYAKLEILRADERFAWNSRHALSEIPTPQLHRILEEVLDLNRATEWMRLYTFFLEAERYLEARETIEEAIKRFPTELGDRVSLITQTDQLLANQKFEEIKLRRSAGQFELSSQLLQSFPEKQLPLETQLKLEDEIKSLGQQVTAIADVAEALKAQVEKLPAADQQVIAGTIQELLDEINFETAVRLSDFQRLRADDSIPGENLVALALGGWLLGPGSGVQNFAVAKSLIRVQGLVKEYLREQSPQRREMLLRELRGEEGAQPALLDKLLEVMKPPLDLPARNDSDPPGLHRITISLPNGEQVSYVVQLPPEYDSNRKYPCVLALPGGVGEAEVQIDWWCGVNVKAPQGDLRFGHATRYGYIVVSPDWMQPNQAEFQYTEGEHQRVLVCLRDAFRRCSIDTDRVFVSGHFEGATAAWDIAQAHPDLWAGAVLISPTADKYIVQYHENVKSSPKTPDTIPLATYIVYGDLDGVRLESQLGTAASRFLKSPAYDSLVVEYIGRGRERFLAELPRIIDWMGLTSHRRPRTPREINATTMRAGDRFFYWLEAPAIAQNSAGNAFQFDPTVRGNFEATLLDSTVNGVRIPTIPSLNRDAIIWLTPDMVDFSRPITVILRSDQSRHNLVPDIAIMLEDARQRADRQHVFWQRISVP